MFRKILIARKVKKAILDHTMEIDEAEAYLKNQDFNEIEISYCIDASLNKMVRRLKTFCDKEERINKARDKYIRGTKTFGETIIEHMQSADKKMPKKRMFILN